MRRFVIAGLICLGSLRAGKAAQAQAFANLDFQAGSFSQDTAAGAFPGWTFTPDVGVTYLFMHLGGNPQRYFNDSSGDYSLAMAAGEQSGFPYSPMTIEQTGLVPSNAKSIRLEAPMQSGYVTTPPTTGTKAWSLLLDGGEIPPVDLGGEYGAAISPAMPIRSACSRLQNMKTISYGPAWVRATCWVNSTTFNSRRS